MKSKKVLELLKGRTTPNQIILLLFLSLSFILFFEFWNSLFADIFVNSFLKYFNKSFISDILFFLTLFFFITYTIKGIKTNKQISISFLVFSVVVAFVYSYYRLSDIYVFFTLKSLRNVCYSDIFLLPMLYSLLLFINNLYNFIKITQSPSGNLLFDLPINQKQDDIYGREPFAKLLAQNIAGTFPSEAFAIGINGEWGVGKTSFINLLKENLSDDDFIFIDFNALNSSNEDNLMDNFFKTLNSKLQKYDSSLSSQLSSYSASLIDNSNNDFIKSIFRLFNNTQDDSLTNKYKNINFLIKAINKRIVIFLDDMDRLQKDEIIMVIKLIRNTANFSNVFYIAAYDRNYIIRSFEELSKLNSIYYLEKIFQLEIDLPHIDSSVLREDFVKKLKTQISETYHPEINKLAFANTSKLYPFFDDYIKSIRDINRFVNLFSFQFNQIHLEVTFVDFFNITLIKLKYPELLQFIYKNQEDIFDTSSNSGQLRLKLKTDGNELLLSKILDNNKSNLNSGDLEINIFKSAIQSMFGRPLTTTNREKLFDPLLLSYYEEKEKYSIVFPNYFYRYFSNKIFSFDISEENWEASLNLPFNDYLTELKKLIDHGARKEIYFRFSMIKDFGNKDVFEKIIKTIFTLSTYSPLNSKIGDAWYDYKTLLAQLAKINKNHDKYYSGDQNAYKSFLNTVLSSEKKPYKYCVGFIEAICTDLNDYKRFSIPLEELILLNVNYLEKYINGIEILDRTAWNLFYSCKTIKFYDDNKYNHLVVEEAKTVMKQFFHKKGIDYLINSVAINRNENQKFILSDGIWAVFGPPDGVVNFLNEFEESELIIEFKDFYSKCKEANFQSYIKYEFKEIKLSEDQ